MLNKILAGMGGYISLLRRTSLKVCRCCDRTVKVSFQVMDIFRKKTSKSQSKNLGNQNMYLQIPPFLDRAQAPHLGRRTDGSGTKMGPAFSRVINRLYHAAADPFGLPAV